MWMWEITSPGTMWMRENNISKNDKNVVGKKITIENIMNVRITSLGTS